MRARKTNLRDYAGYRAWRDAIPWTNQEIAAAIRHDAAHAQNAYIARLRLKTAEWLERPGSRLSSKALGVALPYLVRVCGVDGCGRKALYRRGVTGLCRSHRDVIPDAVKAARRAREESLEIASENWREIDKRLRFAAKAHAYKKACGAR